MVGKEQQTKHMKDVQVSDLSVDQRLKYPHIYITL